MIKVYIDKKLLSLLWKCLLTTYGQFPATTKRLRLLTVLLTLIKAPLC